MNTPFNPAPAFQWPRTKQGRVRFQVSQAQCLQDAESRDLFPHQGLLAPVIQGGYKSATGLTVSHTVLHTYYVRGSQPPWEFIQIWDLFLPPATEMEGHSLLVRFQFRNAGSVLFEVCESTDSCFCFLTNNVFDAWPWLHSHTSSCRHTVTR